MNTRAKGFVTIVGGWLFHLAIGSIYTWGNISIYIASYFRHYEPDLTIDDTFVTFPIMVVSSTIIWYLGSALALRYSPRLSMSIGGVILISGVVASSFVKSFNWFAVLYGLGFGFGYGISLFAPIISAWSYFPKRKGVANGIIIAAFGMGSAVFN